MSDVPDDFKLIVVPHCPNCGSLEVVGKEGYFFCNICGWDQLDGTEEEKQ